MSKHQTYILQDSVEDSSWTTISVEDVTSFYDEENLDATLPVEDLDVEGGEMLSDIKGMNLPCLILPRKLSANPGESPLLPMSMKEFRPAFCSSALPPPGQVSQGGCSNSSPLYVSSNKAEREILRQNGMDSELRRRLLSHQTEGQKHTLKHPAPILREILKLNPPQRLSSVHRVDSGEFKPQLCSTARSESELKFRGCIAGLPENSTLFVPPHFSSELGQATVDLTVPMTQSEFKPQRCSTELQQESSFAFMPLRCSTDLNDSAAFNPILSSTAHQHAGDDVPDLKYLKMSSEKSMK